jgi:hypothetical protein
MRTGCTFAIPTTSHHETGELACNQPTSMPGGYEGGALPSSQ